MLSGEWTRVFGIVDSELRAGVVKLSTEQQRGV